MTSLPKIIRILPQQITFESPFLDSLNTHIVDACQEGNLPLLKSLLSPMREDAIVSPYILSTKERLTTTDYCFVDACKIGHLEMVKYLLVDVATTGYPRARIETEQYQGFIYACLYGHLDVVQYLLTAKELTNNNIPFADMSTRNYIGLQYACTNQHFSIIKYLTTSQELQEAGHKLADIHVGNDHIFTSNASLGYMDIIQDQVASILGDIGCDNITLKNKYNAAWVFIKNRIKMGNFIQRIIYKN